MSYAEYRTLMQIRVSSMRPVLRRKPTTVKQRKTVKKRESVPLSELVAGLAWGDAERVQRFALAPTPAPKKNLRQRRQEAAAEAMNWF